MKNYVEIERTHKTKLVDTITCDICKRIFKGGSWERNSYSRLETEVKLTTGTGYPEGGSGEEIEFDICPECFETKLIPLLKQKFNAEPTVTEWDY